jgi:uncharacterized membrane protein YqhA
VDLQRLKAIHNAVLRGGFCAVWVAALIVAFYEFLYAITSDIGSPEQNKFVLHILGCLGVTIVAAIMHTLIANKND